MASDQTEGNGNGWPKTFSVGRESVTVYRRKTPSGNHSFMVANYAAGKRRFDSYADEQEAIREAKKLARQLSERKVIAATMTNEQASEYAAAVQTLAPCNISLLQAASTISECLKLVGGPADLLAAVKFYAARHKRTIAKPVAEVVAELLQVKEARGASERYLQDLRSRLNRFASDCRKNASDVTTSDIQTWLDAHNLTAQSYKNFRTVLNLLFEFGVARSYASDNPVEGVERVKVRAGDTLIYTPLELSRLLRAASPEFLPCLAIGAFAGLRSAEIERLEWSDIDLAGRFITVSAGKSKTASRRMVPICNALAAWLTPYVERQGKIWPGRHKEFYQAQRQTAAATEVKADPPNNVAAKAPVKWKANALRHSYASYRIAEIGDAGRVAGELGNSAAIVHRHYRELVKPTDAAKWFGVLPDSFKAANITPISNAA